MNKKVDYLVNSYTISGLFHASTFNIPAMTWFTNQPSLYHTYDK